MHALIVGNGTPPPKALLLYEKERADLVIAADGGGNSCMEMGVEPDIVVGDMDSFDSGRWQNTLALRLTDQETNDFEKSLIYAKNNGAHTVTALGVTGERLDHTLKNISVMVQFLEDFESLVVKDALGWMMILPKSYKIDVPVGTVISLFPVSGRVEGIVTKGLEFALNGEILQNGLRDGSSNRAVSPVVEIIHGNGDLLMMVFDGK
jgi:thiamine pyrophosphokinase